MYVHVRTWQLLPVNKQVVIVVHVLVYSHSCVRISYVHAYCSLHACLLPLDIQQVTPQPTCPSSTNASELTTVTHLVMVVRGAHETHHVVCSHWSRTNRQHCVPKLSMWFSVHVLMSSSGVLIATTASLGALWVATMTIFGIVTAVLCSKIRRLKQNGNQTTMECMLQYICEVT